MNLCKYKDAFGKPGEGIHRFRIFNIGVIDVLATLLFAYVIAYFSSVSLVYVMPFVFIFGIVLHRLFCVRTTIDKLLFPNTQ